MAPYESHELRRGKYAKLDAPGDDDVETPTRFSNDSGGTLEDLEEHDPLAFDSRLKRKKSGGDLKIRKASYRDRDSEAAAPFPIAQKKARCAPGRWCCWLLVFIAAVVALLASGGIWAYKVSAPEDGLSPPWYPSPKGGTDKAWEESYKKAAELVKQMTLPEKVNITTGTGWSMDLCVGQTGRVARLKFPSLCLQVGKVLARS
jgi:beta-glucosidase